ncbi:Uncharacterised protein [Pantoea agglomerans]|jgi:hypothetical protein|nr:Uncharacterised protein [Pantoea agglomerans]
MTSNSSRVNVGKAGLDNRTTFCYILWCSLEHFKDEKQ